MTTMTEETNLEAGSQIAAGQPATNGAATRGVAVETPTSGAPATTDGADGGEIEIELQQMEDAANTLQKEGMISESEAEEKREQVARTRKLFRELSPAERFAIVQ